MPSAFRGSTRLLASDAVGTLDRAPRGDRRALQRNREHARTWPRWARRSSATSGAHRATSRPRSPPSRAMRRLAAVAGQAAAGEGRAVLGSAQRLSRPPVHSSAAISRTSTARWPKPTRAGCVCEQARKIAPTTTGDFAARIAALQARMTALRDGLARHRHAQSDLLADIAVDELRGAAAADRRIRGPGALRAGDDLRPGRGGAADEARRDAVLRHVAWPLAGWR